MEKGGIYETQLGVVAHSDGDVIYHSIVDGIFGALTLPDIGQVFQDSDPRWKGVELSFDVPMILRNVSSGITLVGVVVA